MKKAMKAVETSLVQIAMLRRGWNCAELAKRAGLLPHSLSTQFSTGLPNQLCRWKIEAAFGYAEQLWSPAASLATRKHCRTRFGADPLLLTFQALRELAARIRLPGWKVHRTK